jgi:hypothetical protein
MRHLEVLLNDFLPLTVLLSLFPESVTPIAV